MIAERPQIEKVIQTLTAKGDFDVTLGRLGATLGVLWGPFGVTGGWLGGSLGTFLVYFRIVLDRWGSLQHRFDYEMHVSRKYTFFQLILMIFWYQLLDLYSLFDHFGVTLALILTSEGDFGLRCELFGRTLDHLGDKKAIRGEALGGSWGGMERKSSDRNGQKSKKSESNSKNCSYRGRLGVKKVEFSIKNAWNRFANLCSPPRQEQHFWKNVMQKVS